MISADQNQFNIGWPGLGQVRGSETEGRERIYNQEKSANRQLKLHCFPPSQSSLSRLSNTRNKASPVKSLPALLGHSAFSPLSSLRFVCTHSELIQFSTSWFYPPTELFENSVLLETFGFFFLRHVPVSCKVIKGVGRSSPITLSETHNPSAQGPARVLTQASQSSCFNYHSCRLLGLGVPYFLLV